MPEQSSPTPPVPVVAPWLLRPFVAPLRARGTVGRCVVVLGPALVPGLAHVALDGPAALVCGVLSAALTVIGLAALAWVCSRIDTELTDLRSRLDEAGESAERTAAAAAAAMEEQVRGAFVQQQFTERQSRTRAQEVVDDSSSAIVQRLAEVGEQVGSVQASTAVIDDKAAAATAATREILEQAEQADHDVAALEDSLRSVESMASVIAKVADQTKLLALNATIEAARAGAAGDGFRVVAGEVKNLAATTAGSTHEIATTVAAVQSNAHAVLRSLRAVQERIAGIDEAAAGLRSVAVDQRDALVQLQGSVAAAVDGAQQMSDLAATMERRRVSRFPCHLEVRLRLDGTDDPATALDLGLGGVRLTTATSRRIGVGTRVVVHWPHRGTTLDLAGAVARATGTPGRYELGIVFDATGTNAPAGLVEVIDRLQSHVPTP